MIIPRYDYLDRIRKALDFVPIVVLTGARQVGKTTLMHSLDIGGKQLFINGQNPEIIELFSKFSSVEAFLKIELDPDLHGTLFIDEFQYIPDISTILKLLADAHRGLKMICSGSSSLDMMGSVSESMAGRVRVIPVFSLSFREYIHFQDALLYEKLQQYNIHDPHEIIDKRIPQFLNEYLIYGGLPRVALAKKGSDKIDLLADIHQTYLLKDVRNYIRHEDFVGFNKLLKLLALQNGNLININSLSKESSMPYKKTEDLLHILDQMYILRLVSPFVSNKRKEITQMKKVYFTDIGLRNIILNDFNEIIYRQDKGALFENFVYLELAKEKVRPENIRFFRTKDGLEIDFVVESGRSVIPVECKYQHYHTPKSISAIKKFWLVEPFPKAFLVNPDLYGVEEDIHFIPAYFIGKTDLNENQ
jgi:predicted AAA+ superfamily ATPase